MLTRRTFVMGLGALPLAADDWTGFRGPLGNGVSAEKAAPLAWGPNKNVKWRVPLPKMGNGSPIVSKGKVFVTCAEDDDGLKRSVYAFDRKDGRKLWSRTVEFGRKLPTHQTNGYCPSTPAADGERVIVWEGSAGLHAYDYEGKTLWSANLGDFVHMWGDGVSPLIRDGRVFLNCGPGKKIFVAAFDAKTGKELWRTEEPFKGDGERNEDGKYMGSWCTPVWVDVDGRPQLIVSQPTRVVAYDPADGRILWFCDGLRHKKGDLAYSSPVVVGDILVVTGGFNGPAMGVKLGGGKGDVTASHRLWRFESQPQHIGSALAVDGKLYQGLAGPGRLECVDPATGKALWQDAAGGGVYWGSLVLGAGRIYGTNQKGRTVVFKPNPEKFELLASNDLNEACNATPALSDGDLFIRTHAALYRLSE